MDHNNLFEKMYEMAGQMEQFPYIKDTPQPGIWYRVLLEDCKCGNGEPYYVGLKVGTSDGLIVNFHGGGTAWNAYTAARPIAPENFTGNGFYFNRVAPCTDPATPLGILSTKQENCFRDWSVLCVNYTSGDFHIGTADYEYTALDGSRQILHHHGYLNFRKALETVRTYFTDPEKLLICGESAGGFAAYALADDVIRAFPQCKNITVCSDGAHLSYKHWKQVAAKQWGAPEHITAYLTEENYTLGCMLGLYKKYGSHVKYLYISSMRDAALAEFQQELFLEPRSLTKHSGDLAEAVLRDMIQRLEKEMPCCGLYLYDDIAYPGVPAEEKLTLHTILLTDYAYTHQRHGVSPMEWLYRAVNGSVEKLYVE